MGVVDINTITIHMGGGNYGGMQDEYDNEDGENIFCL